MDTERFNTFTVEDFIIDDNFRLIVKNSNADKVLDELILQYPDKKQELLLSAKIIKELNVTTFRQSEIRMKELWAKVVEVSGNDII